MQHKANIKKYVFLLLAFVYFDAFAQKDSIRFLIKNNPMALYRGEFTFSIEKLLKPSITVETTWGILNYNRNASIMLNNIEINEPSTRVIKATGISGSVYIKKFIQSSNWLDGINVGFGITALNDQIDYIIRGSIVNLEFNEHVKAENIGAMFKLGHQKRYRLSFIDMDLSAGYNFKDNPKLSQSFNNRYIKGLTFGGQIRLTTPIYFNDTTNLYAKRRNAIKGSIYFNPFCLFRNGIHLGAMKLVSQKARTYGTLDGFYYPSQFLSSESTNSKFKVYGFQIGSKNYMSKNCEGAYAGLITGYNHLEINDYRSPRINNPSQNLGQPIRTRIKDQATLGIQYGCTLRNTNNFFCDFAFENGLRIGNSKTRGTNNIFFDFSDGSFTKFTLKTGFYFK